MSYLKSSLAGLVMFTLLGCEKPEKAGS
ncbi:hypothetical protein BMETH_11528038851506, partial [methanotrophic bacterial endosymbiont of Bathymodiolus sp.]